MRAILLRFALGSLLLLSIGATIFTDTGCSCATIPNGSSPLGCAPKLDWTAQISKWCLTAGQCGQFHTGFGYVDTCFQAGFQSVTLTPPTYLEWDQTGYTFYTGQTLTVNWTSTAIGSDELLKITYQGVSLRTLTPGVNVTTGSYSSRISDSGNSLTANTSVIVSTVSVPAIIANSTQSLTVLQSKISYVNVYNGPSLITAGNSIPCDDRNITVQWRGLGEAGVGIASVTVKSGFGGGTIVGTPVTGLLSQSNMTINYTLPRGFIPSGFGTTYSAQISVQSPGTGVAPYTLNSVSFSLTAAPSQTPTTTPTPSQTPTPSLSFGATPSTTPSRTATSSSTPSLTSTTSLSISQTATSTPTATPSQTNTPSPTATTPPDLAALAKAAIDANTNTFTIIVSSVIGSIVILCIGAGLSYKFYQRKLLHERRSRKMSALRTRTDDRTKVYGITTVINTPQEQQFKNNLAYRSNPSKRITSND